MRRFAVLGLLAAACSQDVEDNLFDSAGATTPVSAGVGTNASGDDDGDTGRDGSSSSSGDAQDDDGDTGITGPVDDSTDDGADEANPTIGPLDDSGSSGPVDPTIDPTLDPTLDDGGMDDGVLPGGDCCTAHGGLGCDDATVEACVCGLDDVCCSSGWDDICVSEAASCGAPCMGGGGDDVGDCCTPHLSIGCSVPEIESCVCSLDGFCCATEWDEICASEVFDCGYACP